MSTALIVYGSTTGNTESITQQIGEIFEDKEFQRSLP